MFGWVVAHSVHAPEPRRGFYVDCGHAVQFPPSAPVFPGLHLQSVMSTLPAVEIEFAGHDVHTEAPVVVEYLPASHDMHE